MNIPLIMTPKSMVATLSADDTLRQALEKMKHHGYASIPVIDSNNLYVGTLSEGELLWFLFDKSQNDCIDISKSDGTKVQDILNTTKYRSVTIGATIDELFELAMSQNFVPVVDDRGCLSGIVKRSDIMKLLINKGE